MIVVSYNYSTNIWTNQSQAAEGCADHADARKLAPFVRMTYSAFAYGNNEWAGHRRMCLVCEISSGSWHFTCQCGIISAGWYYIFISMPLQVRRPSICSLHIGQLYRIASLMWYNECMSRCDGIGRRDGLKIHSTFFHWVDFLSTTISVIFPSFRRFSTFAPRIW